MQQRVSSLGIDRTALLTSLGIPLAPQLEATGRALDALPRDQWDQLVKRAGASRGPEEPDIVPP